MCATVSCVSVHSPTCAPRRAAAYAASHPACPAPITMTSKFFISHHRALATPEGTAEHAQQSIFITRTLPRVLSPRRHENTKTPRRRSVCHGQKQPPRPQSTRSRRREKYPLRSLRSPRFLLTRKCSPRSWRSPRFLLPGVEKCSLRSRRFLLAGAEIKLLRGLCGLRGSFSVASKKMFSAVFAISAVPSSGFTC